MFVVNKSKENIFIIVPIIILSLLITAFGVCGDNHLEKYYQEIWCNEHQGKTEVVLKDKTRCDCLTSEFAIEFDFGAKWYQAIGQSLYYSALTKNKAGIVLIIKKEKDYKYWIRMNKTIGYFNLPITTWLIRGY